MAANKHLQRRAGRRTSLPTSPVILERRSGDRVFRPEPNSPQDNGSAILPENPSLDVQLSSPTFDVLNRTSPASATDLDDFADRSWGRVDRLGTKQREEYHNLSPVSTFTVDGNQSRSSRFQQLDPSFRGSPLTSSNRDSSDAGLRFDTRDRFYERGHVSARNYSTTSLAIEKSMNDESGRTSIPKKSRLNLLNPMSLLARRRSSQSSKLEDLNISPLHAPAIPDFDPSIRGKIVHDFSTPRQRTPRRDAFPSPVPPLATSSPVMYSPIFKEHFQDEDRVLQPTQTAYLHNKPLDAPTPQSLPAFAKSLPTTIPLESTPGYEQTTISAIPHPDVPPPPPPKGTPSPVLEIPVSNQLPRHMKSTSSRFSFQMVGHGSAAQEKILEDKHREHYPKNTVNVRDIDDIVEDDYDDYDPDMPDVFEEEIGMSGLDDDAYAFAGDDMPTRNIEVQTSQNQLPNPGYNSLVEKHESPDVVQHETHKPVSAFQLQTQAAQPENQQSGQIRGASFGNSTQNFHFTPHSDALSPTSTRYGSEPTPRDADGFPIGVANTAYSPLASKSDASGHHPAETNEPLFFEGLKISTTDDFKPKDDYKAPNYTFDDADLYFDDGEFASEFEHNVHDVTDCFDESMLEDGSSHIRDIPAENARRYKAALENGGLGAEVAVVNPSHSSFLADFPGTKDDETNQIGIVDSQPSTRVLPENDKSMSNLPSGLTEDNLAAYHDALALAANKAEASGRFNRQVSFNDTSELPDRSSQILGPPGFVNHGIRSGFDVEDVASTGVNDFEFDDDGYDDDLMIAEANAEALENDDDGFYGQEFGFYARAHGKESSALSNGGFFTSRGQNGIKRSHSGKATFQEPNLTPITEKSEWSARNSIASFPLHGGIPVSAQSLPSPGLSQLMDSPLLEDDMTLSALMRLRRGTFGGSSTSINSLGERSLPNSSPLAHASNQKFPSSAESGHGRKISTTQSLKSSTSIIESSEEDDEYGDRNTLTQNTPRKAVAGLMPQTPQEQTTQSLMPHTMQAGKKGHHSRNSSGAESVSYTQDNSGRWILERRRTGDDGELEVIAREYLAGARI